MEEIPSQISTSETKSTASGTQERKATEVCRRDTAVIVGTSLSKCSSGSRELSQDRATALPARC